ncbi:MAG: hypothetical protein WA152_01820 [Microgenomates group bacterium]
MALLKQIKNPLSRLKDGVGIKIDSRFEKIPLKSLFLISIIVNILFILLGLVSQLVLPPEVPLFYGLPKNSEQLAPSLFIIVPAVISLFITVVNAVISINVDSTYLKKTLAFASISVCLLSVIATYKIIFLVGSI